MSGKDLQEVYLRTSEKRHFDSTEYPLSDGLIAWRQKQKCPYYDSHVLKPLKEGKGISRSDAWAFSSYVTHLAELFPHKEAWKPFVGLEVEQTMDKLFSTALESPVLLDGDLHSTVLEPANEKRSANDSSKERGKQNLFARNWLNPHRDGVRIHSEKGVRSHCKKTFSQAAYQRAEFDRSLVFENDKAARAYEMEYGFPFSGTPQDFMDFAVAMWDEDWATHLWAVVGRSKTRAGGLAILPLKDRAYERVYASECGLFDLTPDDLSRQSLRFLFIGAPRIDNSSVGPIRRRFAESACLLMHLGLRLPELRGGLQTDLEDGVQSLRFLAFSPTPKTSITLPRRGFKPVGRTLARSICPLYEFDSREQLLLRNGLSLLRLAQETVQSYSEPA